MKKKSFHIGLVKAAVAIIGFSGFFSCIDPLNTPTGYLAEVTFPAEAHDGILKLKAQSTEFTLGIKTEGSWYIESDRRFLRANPAEGTGEAQVTIAVQANQSEDDKVGKLTVIFPGHEEKNRTLSVQQACASPELEVEGLNTSTRGYAVGYSYDTVGEYANPNSVRMEVFDTKALIEDEVLAVNTSQVSLTDYTITGSSISEMTNQLAVQANVNGGYGKFKAEASASFNMDHAESNEYEYATTYFDLTVRKASLSKDLEKLKDDYMTDDAYVAINGIETTNARGVPKTAYPSNNEGFKRLIENYGTHVIVDAGLGGRIRYSMEIDISKIESSYDAKAFIKASYSNAFASASGSVDEQFKQSFEENKESVTIRLNVLGGDESASKKLGLEGGFSKENLADWVQSVTADNLALVSFSRTSLVPLYELVERNATADHGGFDGEARYQALKTYMEGQMVNDFAPSKCGTVTEFEIPDFKKSYRSSNNYFSLPFNINTLIQDIMLGGQWVGQICEEFIPEINRNERVVVVYPVISNTPRYNMGVFLGDNTHKPARVAWNGTTVAIQEYADLEFGQATKLYLRGATVTPAPAEATEVLKGTLDTEWLTGRYFDFHNNIVCNYPLVKIFDHVWTRFSYHGRVSGNKDRPVRDQKLGTWNMEYYSFDNAGKSANFPSGWGVPKREVYQQMKDKLAASGYPSAGLALLEGGVTGFDVVFLGWHNTWEDLGWRGDDKKEMDFLARDGYVEILKNGSFNVKKSDSGDLFMCVRLVKE